MRGLIGSSVSYVAGLELSGLVIGLLKATLLLLAVRLLVSAWPRVSAASRHLVLTLGMAGFLVLPVLMAVVPGWQLPLPAGLEASLQSVLSPGEHRSARDAGLEASGPALTTGGVRLGMDEGGAAGEPATLALTSSLGHDGASIGGSRSAVVTTAPLAATASAHLLDRAREVNWAFLLLAVWSIGALVFLGQMMVGLLRFGWLARRCERVEDETALYQRDLAQERLGLDFGPALLRSEYLPVPITGGLINPVVILPASADGWTPARLRVVLLHELAHLRRRDHLTLLLNRFVASVFWFHPMAWSTERAARLASESACDDLVLDSGTRASDYAAHLLSIARSLRRGEPVGAVTLAVARKSQLEGRLLAILNPRLPRHPASKLEVALATAAFLALMTPLAGAQLYATTVDAGDAEPVQVASATRPGEAALVLAATAEASSRLATLLNAPEAAPSALLSPQPRPASAPEPASMPRPASAPEPASMPTAIPAAVPSATPAAMVVPAPAPAWNGEPSLAPVPAPAPSSTLLARRDKHDVDDDRTPTTGQGWYERGSKLHRSDRYEEAIEAFKKAIELGHAPATSMYNIACGYSLLNQKDEALRWLERSLKEGFKQTDLLAKDSDLDPLRTDARFKRLLDTYYTSAGKGAKEPDRLEAAGMHYNELKSSNSRSASAWKDAGYRLVLVRDTDRALDALRRSLELAPDQPTVMYNMACAYALANDRARGIEWLERAIENGFDDPDKVEKDPDLDSLRGDSRFDQLQKAAAFYSLDRFRKNDKGWGRSEYSKKRWAPAVEQFDRYTRSNPRSGRAWFNLGYALHYSGEHVRATDAFQRAVELNYRRATSSYNTACAYAKADRKDEAFDWLKRSVDADPDVLGYILNDSDLDNLRNDARFDRFEQLAEERMEKKHQEKKAWEKEKHKQKDKQKHHDKDKH